MTRSPVTTADYAAISALIPCPAQVFRAVCLVESRGHGFDDLGHVVCLVEPHVIWRHATAQERAILKPYHLAYPVWGMYPYGKYSDQWPKFQKIAALTGNHNLAIMGTSFGMLQILGENYRECAHATPEEFFVSMCNSEQDQLHDGAMMMRSRGMADYMVARNWHKIAEKWNGTGQVDLYATKLEAAYRSVLAGNAPLIAVTAPVKVNSALPIKSPVTPTLTRLTSIKYRLNMC